MWVLAQLLPAWHSSSVMVTATLTAAAVKSQIACQQQRLESLQATLSTMESGMDRHMLQVRQAPRRAAWIPAQDLRCPNPHKHMQHLQCHVPLSSNNQTLMCMHTHILQVQVKYAQGYLESLREQLAALQGHKLPPDTGAPDTAPTATAHTAHPAAGQAAVASATPAESCAQHQQQRQLPEQYGCCVAAGAGQQQQLKGGEECQGNTSHAAAEAAATPATAEPDYEDLTVPGAVCLLVEGGGAL